jgi:hypothetical protein
MRYRNADDAIEAGFSTYKERKEERGGICKDCREHSTLSDPCCGAPLWIEGGWVSPELDEDEDEHI